MKAYFPPMFVLLVMFTVQELIAQDSTLCRFDAPVVLKIGSEGLGVDYTLGKDVAVDITTLVSTTHSRVRLMFIRNNRTPFIGVGFGFANAGVGEQVANRWVTVHIGLEQSYKHLQAQVFFQSILTESNELGTKPPLISFSIGYRP